MKFAPQLIYLALIFFGTGIAIKEHGETKVGKYNAFTHLISISLGLLLIYWGGFFDGLIAALAG